MPGRNGFDELFNFNINELPPDLELIKIYPDIMSEEIEYIESEIKL